jgi:RNA polymerase sigma factor (sigma-70 family)
MRDDGDALPGRRAGTTSADETPELAACLRRLSAGDLTARDRIIELVSGRLRALARRMLARFPNVRRWDDTDDVFQNAALRLHRALGRSDDPPRSVMALAAAELHRELLDLARKYAGPRSHASHHATNTIRGATGAAVARHDERAIAPDDGLDRWDRFHDAIARLPPCQREVFDLVWYLGADQRTAADLLGCSVRTVKSRWREVRDVVCRALDGDRPT